MNVATALLLELSCLAFAVQPGGHEGRTPAPATTPAPTPDWRTAEASLLTDHVQVTSRDRFVKAGEAYFDHDLRPRWIVFQAIATPRAGQEPDAHYAMYVAKLRYQGESIVGADEPIKVSPDGSANTCGWFHPRRPYELLFASTIKPPAAQERSGFRVGSRNYVWQFPDEMEILTRSISAIALDQPGPFGEQARGYEDLLSSRMPSIQAALKDGRADEHDRLVNALWEEADSRFPLARSVKNWIGGPLFEKPKYTAESSFSPDARHVLYAQVREEQTRGRDDADIWVFDTATGRHTALITADGYDGGPFFSPDGTRICYRSDRAGDDKLQLFVADLKIEDGAIVGVERETQVTANQHVNWAPFWHPGGKFLVYGSSEVGHQKYEIFAVQTPVRGQGASPGSLKRRRITQANGADVLPAFSVGGNWLIWTAQRGPLVEGETRPSSQVWIARVKQGQGSMFDADGLFRAE